MRKVILFIACSLDNYIAGPEGRIDCLFSDQDYGYREFFLHVDTVVMGRKTYELSLSFGEYPYPGREAYVFSRSRSGRHDEHAQFISFDPEELIAELRSRPGKNIWLVGGSELIKDFVCYRESVEVFYYDLKRTVHHKDFDMKMCLKKVKKTLRSPF